MSSVFPQEVIEIFEEIRDIPYRAPESLEDDIHTCWGKNILLYERLKKAGFVVRHRVNDCIVGKQGFSEEIKKLWPKGVMKHLSIEIYIGGKWRLLDATWDSKLHHFNDIRKQDECIRFGVHEEPYLVEEGERIIKEYMGKMRGNYEEHKSFYQALNKIFEEKRRIKASQQQK